MKNYVATIGLEIHAELKTGSKMFCNCKNPASPSASQGGEPFSSQTNINICPICLGMPGTLPVLNRQAIEWTIKTGLALNCKIASITKWDRKNYFYPDLPKGYQISQYDVPICQKGFLEVLGRKIKITRIHLEEDTGTLKHPEGRTEVDYSLADYNRAGVPLMELVTEPDITTAQEAKLFCQNYQQILRTLKIADADMEKGQMRCEVNISLREIADPRRLNAELRGQEVSVSQRNSQRQSASSLGTKVEVKNLNSFKAVEKAINYEIERQTEVLASGDKVVQETRGWDDRNGKTYTMRVKETSADYRYFPEPDLPPVKISDREINMLKKDLPELPENKINRYIKQYNLVPADATIIVLDRDKFEFFEKAIEYTKHFKDLSLWIINELDFIKISPKNAGELVNLVKENIVSRNVAKTIFPDLLKGKSPREIIKTKGLNQISNTEELNNIIKKIISANPKIIETIKAGKTQAIGFLVGQVMKETKGQANPELASRMIKEAINV